MLITLFFILQSVHFLTVGTAELVPNLSGSEPGSVRVRVDVERVRGRDDQLLRPPVFEPSK